MKKVIAFALVLLMIMPLLVFRASADTVTPDTSWYDASKTEFTITTAAQLYGLASLSRSNNFAGKTVKLGADITVNEGDAKTWASTAPANIWTPIGAFAGTFDGEGHTLSGLYYKGTAVSGLFGIVSGGALITDFKLTNSYIETGENDAMTGGIAGQSGGATFTKIYCDAIVAAGGHHAGGIVALCGAGETIVEDCWFDGSVTIAKRYAAGIVGNGNGNTVTIRHCLNTGSVYTSWENGNACIGGIMGRNDATSTIEDCLNVGSVSTAASATGEEREAASILSTVGLNTKNPDGTWKSRADIANTWASEESCPLVVALNNSTDPSQKKDYTAIPEALLTGYAGYLNTTLDFENHWAVNMNGTPVLQIFAEVIPQLYDVSIPEITATEVKAEGHYGPRWTLTLKIPEGMKKDDITVGVLIVPTKALPEGRGVNLLDTSFTYRDQAYEVANVEGKILRESDDNTIVATFVITDLCAANARINFTAVPYAVYQVEEGELAMYGQGESVNFYKEAVLSLEDPSVDETVKAYTEAVLAPIDKDLGGRFPVAADWTDMALFEEIPALAVDDTKILAPEDKGLGNYVITVEGTVDSDYFDYLEVMETFGFEKIYDNSKDELNAGADAIYTATYQKGDLFVTVTDLGYSNKCTVSAMYGLELSEHLYDNFKGEADANKKTTMAMMELCWFGTSIVVQMKNGHFLIWDGGMPNANRNPGDVINTLEYMESLVPAGEKPVVEGWFVSHYHADHFYLMRDFVDSPELCDRLYVEGFYSSVPSNAVCDLDPGVYTEMDYEFKAMSMLKTASGKTPVHYRVQTGQTYYFCDISVDIMLTQEQIPFADYKTGFNDSSTWYQINIEGQNVVYGGDSHYAGMGVMLSAYDWDYLDFDIFYALHHGWNTWDTFTNACTFHTVMWPHEDSAVAATINNPANDNLRQVVRDAGGDNYLGFDSGTVVLTFPYVHGSNSGIRLPLRAR